MNKKSFKIIGLVSLVASTVLLVACQSDTKKRILKVQGRSMGLYWMLLVQTIGMTFLKDYELSKKW